MGGPRPQWLGELGGVPGVREPVLCGRPRPTRPPGEPRRHLQKVRHRQQRLHELAGVCIGHQPRLADREARTGGVGEDCQLIGAHRIHSSAALRQIRQGPKWCLVAVGVGGGDHEPTARSHALGAGGRLPKTRYGQQWGRGPERIPCGRAGRQRRPARGVGGEDPETAADLQRQRLWPVRVLSGVRPKQGRHPLQKGVASGRGRLAAGPPFRRR
mmetsp:Transcript_49252/g.158996  ORF Transcript_49252/g.158996 Transcript_49252/m.158996 type:complete len:214 (+) Transcript_49252:196-837(+)